MLMFSVSYGKGTNESYNILRNALVVKQRYCQADGNTDNKDWLPIWNCYLLSISHQTILRIIIQGILNL